MPLVAVRSCHSRQAPSNPANSSEGNSAGSFGHCSSQKQEVETALAPDKLAARVPEAE